MQYDMDGVFVGNVSGESAAVNISIEVDATSTRWTVGSLGSEERSTLESSDRRVWHFQKEALRRIQAEAFRSRKISPNFKVAPQRRKRKVVPVTCPVCGGYRSFDCDTCEGAGVVPG